MSSQSPISELVPAVSSTPSRFWHLFSFALASLGLLLLYSSCSYFSHTDKLEPHFTATAIAHSTLQPTFTPHAVSQEPPASHLTHYVITATIDLDPLQVRGQETVTFYNHTDRSLNTLVFRLYTNTTAIYGYAEIDVHTATVNDTPVYPILENDDTVVRLVLPRPLAPQETLTAQLTFTTYPSRGVSGYGIASQADGVLVLGGWYPMLAVYRDNRWDTPPIPAVGDAVTSPAARYSVTVNGPAHHMLVSTGTAQQSQARGRRTLWQIQAEPVRDFAMALSDRWENHSLQVGKTTLNFYALPGNHTIISQAQALEMAREAFETFELRFGPYPYSKVDIVEAVVPIGGYEYPGLALVEAGCREAGASCDFEFALVHELAHQWWYGVVGNDVVREPWLDESLATYAVALHRERMEGREAAAELLDTWSWQYVPDAGDGPVNQPATAFDTWPPYRGAVYYKGALFWDALRTRMGDESFFSMLLLFYQDHAYQWVTTEDWFLLAQKMGGPSVEQVFATWGTLPASEN